MGPQLLAVVAYATDSISIDSGVFAFASTTLILSLYNAQTRGISTPNVVVGMAMFVGGLAQLLAGMWEVAVGNTFGATGKNRAPRQLYSLPCIRSLPFQLMWRLPGDELQLT